MFFRSINPKYRKVSLLATKGPNRRLGGGGGQSEWEPIKNLLQRANSAYTPNSQPRIPTRVCQGHVVTTDLPTLGTNPNDPKAEARVKKQRT
jgi:hypothetical protein